MECLFTRGKRREGRQLACVWGGRERESAFCGEACILYLYFLTTARYLLFFLFFFPRSSSCREGGKSRRRSRSNDDGTRELATENPPQLTV